MASRKKSDSGAYMSAYDNEVEAKLKVRQRKIVDGMQCHGVVRSFGSDKYRPLTCI